MFKRAKSPRKKCSSAPKAPVAVLYLSSITNCCLHKNAASSSWLFVGKDLAIFAIANEVLDMNKRPMLILLLLRLLLLDGLVLDCCFRGSLGVGENFSNITIVRQLVDVEDIRNVVIRPKDKLLHIGNVGTLRVNIFLAHGIYRVRVGHKGRDVVLSNDSSKVLAL